LAASLLIGCEKRSKPTARICLKSKHEVYLYATNRSRTDSLAKVIIEIDDSTVINKFTPRNEISSEKFEKMIHLCDGPHKVHVQFGRYSKDTTIVVNREVALLTSMVHGDNYTDDNGLAIVTIIRDGSGGRD
jgi:hypothetical protein